MIHAITPRRRAQGLVEYAIIAAAIAGVAFAVSMVVGQGVQAAGENFARAVTGQSTTATYSISGTITDINGNPVPGVGVAVTFFRDPTAPVWSGITDANGQYTIGNITAGNAWAVQASACDAWSDGQLIASGSNATGVNFVFSYAWTGSWSGFGLCA